MKHLAGSSASLQMSKSNYDDLDNYAACIVCICNNVKMCRNFHKTFPSALASTDDQ